MRITKAAFVALAIFVGFGSTFAYAQSATTSPSTGALAAQVGQLLEMIKKLQADIAALQAKQSAIVGEVKDVLRLNTELREGMTSDEVRLLQEILATDPSVYPEGRVTGFFGPLTKKAVMKFESKHGLPADGELDATAKELINEILSATDAQVRIPMGLLVSPGASKVKVMVRTENGMVKYEIEREDGKIKIEAENEDDEDGEDGDDNDDDEDEDEDEDEDDDDSSGRGSEGDDVEDEDD